VKVAEKIIVEEGGKTVRKRIAILEEENSQLKATITKL
jgi:hypothetical protein